MSTCIRGGVSYKRHHWVNNEKTKGLVCTKCGLFPSTVDLSQEEVTEPSLTSDDIRELQPTLLP